jgi:HAD superfamily hydrolase (TIGR01549 family)
LQGWGNEEKQDDFVEVKAIIFDIDGVLADSRKAVAHNTKCLMREFGYDVADARVDGMSTAHSAESVLVALAPPLSKDSSLLKKMLARLAALTKENMGLVEPAPLARAVPALAKRYLLAAASNRKSSARMVLHELGIENHFKAVVTSADAPPKPNPEMITLALERLGVRASEAVFVGDNREDKQAGEGAGVRSIMIDGTDDAACSKFLGEFLG